jgi:hypothetical protein
MRADTAEELRDLRSLVAAIEWLLNKAPSMTSVQACTAIRVVLADYDDHQAVPRCAHVSDSPWGPAQCVLPLGHEERHAYSPSEALP